MIFSRTEIKLIQLLQTDLPCTHRPFEDIAEKIGISEEEVIQTIKEWKKTGVIRRFGALLAHRKAGISANGMVVWNAPEDKIEEIGGKFAASEKVSHCYARPKFKGWDYRLYTMVHGRTREEVHDEAQRLSKLSGINDYFILFSTREFKKSDTQLFCENDRDPADED